MGQGAFTRGFGLDIQVSVLSLLDSWSIFLLHQRASALRVIAQLLADPLMAHVNLQPGP